MLRIPTILFASAIGFGATPAAAEVFQLDADGFITRDTVTVAATPRATWLALIKPADWWSNEHTWSGDASNMTLTPQGGGCFCERIPGSDSKDGFELSGSVQHGTVVQAHPLKALRLIGSLGPLQSEPVTGVLTFVLKEIDGGTQIQLEYTVGGKMRFKTADMAPAVDKVLSEQLARLRDHLGPLETTDNAAKAETKAALPGARASGDRPMDTIDPDIDAQIDSSDTSTEPGL